MKGSPLWHRTCAACGDDYEQPRKIGAPRKTCGKPLCIAILRYGAQYGRWPPRCWFTTYAVQAGLLKLPRRLAKIAAGPPIRDAA